MIDVSSSEDESGLLNSEGQEISAIRPTFSDLSSNSLPFKTTKDESKIDSKKTRQTKLSYFFK
jgi:hypothetical protein